MAVAADEHFFADPSDPEPDDLRVLQQAYRERVRKDAHLYHDIGQPSELENRILKLRDDLTHLRRGVKQWSILVLALLVIVVAAVAWVIKSQQQASRATAEVKDELAQLRQALVAFPRADAVARQQAEKRDPAAAEAEAWRKVAAEVGLDEKELRQKLPAYATRLLAGDPKRELTSFAPASDRANAAYILGDYTHAEEFFLAAAAEARDKSPPGNADAIQSFEGAAHAANARNRYDDALRHLREAEKLTDRARDSVEWARLQHEVAQALFRLGRAPEAEPILRAVVALREQVPGPEHPDTLEARGDLLDALDVQGNHAEAEKELRIIYSIQERTLGPEHPDFLLTRRAMAGILLSRGKNAEAEKELRAVLSIQERVIGREDPDTLDTRNRIAWTLVEDHRFQEAEQEIRPALEIMMRVLGSDNPKFMDSRDTLAEALRGQGKLQEAEAEHRALLALGERTFGVEHPMALHSCQHLAATLAALKKYPEALGLVRRAEQGFKKIWGVESHDFKEAKALREEIEAALAKEKVEGR